MPKHMVHSMQHAIVSAAVVQVIPVHVPEARVSHTSRSAAIKSWSERAIISMTGKLSHLADRYLTRAAAAHLCFSCWRQVGVVHPLHGALYDIVAKRHVAVALQAALMQCTACSVHDESLQRSA